MRQLADGPRKEICENRTDYADKKNKMNKENYKNEKYFDTSPKLLVELDRICEMLVKNLKTKGKSYTAEEIVKSKSFNALWDEKPNKLDNKYSKNEFKGVYAFASVDKQNKIDFMYVGISQTTRRRFSAHTKRTTRPEASWAYLMIKRDFPKLTKEQREKKIPEYQKKVIYPLRFTFCPIDDNMLLHIAEVYCVNKLKAFWNSFETH